MMEQEKAIESILLQVAAIKQKKNTVDGATGRNFNVFELLDMERNEVRICRILCGLLDCNGSHGQGDFFLRQFCNNVLEIEMSNDELETAAVYTEYPVKGGSNDSTRRIDIAIETGSRFIPIEVKIDADDLDKQCSDYYEFAKSKHKEIEPTLFYLTLDGKEPSEKSCNGLSVNKEIKCISFAYDVTRFLNACICDKQIIQIAPIREVLLQFLMTIQRISNNMEDDKMNEIEEILSKNEESMKNAALIIQSFEKCRIAKMEEYFKAVEDKMKQQYGRRKNYDAQENDYKYIFENGKNYPGISYLLKELYKKDDTVIEAWVRLEISDKPYIGICIALNHKWVGDKLKDFYSLIPSEFIPEKVSSWWVRDWEYVGTKKLKAIPQFKTKNDAFYSLFDKDNFEAYVAETVESLNEWFTKWTDK